MGARWGGVPENLYGDIDYTPYNQLSSIMETTENADFSYGRNMGAGSIGDINKKLNYGLHSQNEVQYV